MPAFNDCRCQKCDAKIGWLGELSNPPPCPECGYVSDYSDVEKGLAEAREQLLREIDREVC